MKKLLYICSLMLVIGACTKDGFFSGPDPEGTVTVNLNSAQSGVSLNVNGNSCGMYCTVDANLYISTGGWKIASVGKVNGLGSIKSVPSTGWANEVAAEKGCGYVIKREGDKSSDYIRLVVTDLQKSVIVGTAANTGAQVIGSKVTVKYQAPFVP